MKKNKRFTTRADFRQETPSLIREVCKKLNWNMTQLSTYIGKSVYALARWHAGLSSPNRFDFQKLKDLASGDVTPEGVSVKKVSEAAYLGVQAQILEALGEIKYRLGEIEKEMKEKNAEFEQRLQELEASRPLGKVLEERQARVTGKTFKKPTNLAPG